MKWEFAKYSGCGNDFILFDNRKKIFPLSVPLIKNLCHRQEGIGGDGVILLEKSEFADFRMRIFNSDGSEAEMCGNGMRCLAKFIQIVHSPMKEMRIQIMNRVLRATLDGTSVTIDMGSPTHIRMNLPIIFRGKEYETHFLDTGVPHAVLFVDNISSFDLETIGPYFRHHPEFAPNGTNVNIVELIEPQKIKIRTFERGVEAETMACGSGATASALAAALRHQLTSPISVILKSEEILIINFILENNHFSNVTLTGGARLTFQGFYEISNCFEPSYTLYSTDHGSS